MLKSTISLITFLLMSSTVLYAQDNKASSQNTKTASVSEKKSKDTVEQMLADAEKRGEPILGACLDDCDDSVDPKTVGVERGRPIKLHRPIYPSIAYMSHASGEVQVRLIIDVDGKVIAASAVSGHPLLRAACVTAAWQARFTPTKQNGQPVKVTGIIRYNFVNK
jgi:TonB family protein